MPHRLKPRTLVLTGFAIVATTASIQALTRRIPARQTAVIALGYRNAQHIIRMGLIAAAVAPGDTRIRIPGMPDSTPTGPHAEIEQAARFAAIPGIAGVVGNGGSREALQTAPIYNENGIPQILPTATSRRLAAAGPWTFTLAPNDSLEGEFLGRFVAGRLHARQVTVFYVLDEYGAGLRDGVVAALGAHGVQVLDAVPVGISGECAPYGRTNDYAIRVQEGLRHGRPDAIVLATRQGAAGCIAREATRLLHRPVPIVAGDGLIAGPEYVARAGQAAADSTYIAAFWHPERDDAVSREFVQRYLRLFGRAPTHEQAMMYDAVLALITAVREVGTDRAAIRAYLESLGRTRAALHGVTGAIAFPAGPERLTMTRIRGASLDLVEP